MAGIVKMNAALNEASPTVPTQRVGLLMKVLAKMNSSQAVKNEITAVATRAGSESGRTIRQIVVNGPHPSTNAASSISFGMESKNPFSVQMQSGSAKVQSAMMSPANVSRSV